MTDQTYKIDSSAAQADLKKLAQALDNAAAAAKKMDSGLAGAVTRADASINRATRSMAKFAEVATQLSKVKFAGAPAKNITEFADALNKLGRTRAFDGAKIKGLRDLANILPTLRAPTGGGRAAINFLNALGAVRTPTTSSIMRLKDLFKVLNGYQPTAATRQVTGLRNLFQTLAAIRVPTASQIARLERMFQVLASARAIPGAKQIAADLDHIAASAARAAAAINALPARLRGLGPTLGAQGKQLDRFNSHLGGTENHARRGQRGLVSFGGELGRLNTRFKLTYQAGTLVNAMFASLTVGTFIKGIYDTGVAFAKLEKSMLFVTGTFDGATKATQEYLKMSTALGANALANADAFGRFAISAGAAGLNIEQTMSVYKGAQTALTAVGATAQQTGLAFYGISQMMAKGKVSSEEFNRQIGEQIPGNVAAGVKALSQLTGKTESAASFFDAMRKGAIQSKPFITLWAAELDKMFKVLLPIAEKRPDVQLNRLMTAFDVFKKRIGDAGFLSTVASQFKRFADMLVGKDGNLTAKAQQLADAIGQGLAKAVKMLGDGLVWLVDHLDQVVLALKAVAAFAIGKTLLDMGAKAVAAAQGFQQLVTSVSGLEKKFAQGGGAAAALNVGAPGRQNAPQRLTGTQKLIQSRAIAAWAQNGPIAAPSMGAKLGAAGMAAMGGAAKAGVAAVGALRVGLAALPGVFMAAAVAAAVFGDKIVEISGSTLEFGKKSVQINDIVMGSFEYLGESIMASINDTLAAFGKMGGEGGKPIKSLGDLILDVAAGFIYAGRMIFTVAQSIGKVLGGLLSDVIIPVVASLARLGKGDFMGAAREASKFASGAYLAKSIGEAYGDITKAGGSFGEIREGIFANAARRADGRSMPSAQDFVNEAAGDRAKIEEELARRRSEDARLEREALVAAIERTNRLGELQAPTLESLLEDLNNLTKSSVKSVAETAKNTKDTAINTKPPGSAGGSHTYASLQAAYTGGGAGGGTSSAALAAAPAAVRSVLERAAAQTGVSASLLAAIAKRESGFNPNAANPQSSARGMFQFLTETGKNYGLSSQDRFDPMKSAVAAGRYAQDNLAFLRKHLGAEVQEADAYTAHFMGPQGALNLLRSPKDAIAASLFPKAAASNRNVFYDKDGKARTAAQVVSNLRGTVVGGATTGAGVGGIGSPTTMTDAGEESFETKYANLLGRTARVLGRGSPEFEAMGERADNMIQMQKVIEGWKDLLTDPQLKDAQNPLRAQIEKLITPEALKEYVAFQDKVAADKLNPFKKLADEAAGAARVSEMRLKGLGDEADFQEKLNGFLAEGYDITKLNTAENLANFKSMQQQNRALASQAELLGTLNDIEVQRRQRRGSAFDGVYADLVNSSFADGDFASKMSRAAGDPNIAARARAIVGETQSAGMDSVRNNLRELIATSKMSDSARAWRDDYKTFLESASGLQRETLGELERDTSAAQQAFAKNAADIKKIVENPPGFQRWADSLAPVSERLEDIKANFAESLSGAITDSLMGDDVDWTAMFRDLNRQVLKVHVDEMLKGIIGGGNSLMGKLFGKDQTDPMAALGQPLDPLAQSATTTAVQVDTMAASATSAASALQGLAMAAQSAAAGSATSSAFGVPGNWGPADLSGLRAVNDNSIVPGLFDSTGGAGFQSSASRMASLEAAFSGGSPAAAGGGFMSRFGGGLKNMATIAGLSWLGRKLAPKKKQDSAYEVLNVPGVLGSYSGEVSGGEMIEAKANKTGSILGAVANLALSSFMGGGGGGKFFGLFSEGGMATSPVAWGKVPAYAEGTPNTSTGVGIPAILHPDEAVIPLTRGRKVPIEGGVGTRHENTTINRFTIVTPNPEAFRASQNSIQRKLNRDQKRAQLRNLNA